MSQVNSGSLILVTDFRVADRDIRQRFRCRVRYRITHNHTVEESAKHYSVKKDIKDKILQMFREVFETSYSYQIMNQSLALAAGTSKALV